ncbi:MAG: hypothetical protein HY079_14765 [Elusimicrobia bacterium]|nr:hypothetical protein [Elusimicrobiota bacterium]
MTLAPYHLHPAAVHVPIALLAVGLAAAAARLKDDAPDWLGPAASWALWLGTASLWVALGLGVIAEKTAPHRPLAWEVLADHETLAWWTAGAFTALSLLRGWAVRTRRFSAGWRAATVLLWAAAYALLVATAMHGAELVYRFGMGVVLPD